MRSYINNIKIPVQCMGYCKSLLHQVNNILDTSKHIFPWGGARPQVSGICGVDDCELWRAQ